MKNTEKTMEKVVALCKGRGFIFAGSEIYGGLANTWDYGPLGVELKNNVKKAWWKKFVQENPYNVGLDAAILMNPQTWVASGHLGGFSDPLMDCKECKERFRADKVIEDWCQENNFELPKPIDAFEQSEMKDFVEEHNICGGLGSAVCDVLSASYPVPVLKVGVEDKYGKSGTVPALLEAAETLPTAEEAEELLKAAGAPVSNAEIKLPYDEAFIEKTLTYAPYVRNRLTLLKVIQASKR